MQYDINIEQIYSKIYTEKLYNVKLKAKLISKFKVTQNKVAYLINTYQDVLKYNLPILIFQEGWLILWLGLKALMFGPTLLKLKW